MELKDEIQNQKVHICDIKDNFQSQALQIDKLKKELDVTTKQLRVSKD